MGVLFWVNALGAPVVARAAMEGRHNETGTHKPWWVPDF
ncbi:hypothetical protein C2862_23995 [Massilia sp. Mn16-1_5]|nr:hypothetical protein C2862_23995 [Massilia sp. Mn16-1_5]